MSTVPVFARNASTKQGESWLSIASKYAVPLLIVALAAWFIYDLFATVQRIIYYYNPFPVWDYWRVMQYFRDYKSHNLSVLWRQHNEHRIIFPEIIYALDSLFWHGREILPLIISFLCYLCVWLLFSNELIRDNAPAGRVTAIGVLLSGVIAFWPGVASVLGTPFLLQWPLSQFAATASLVCLSRASRSGSFLFSAIGFGAIATYSSGNGLTLWVVLIAAALLLRLNKRKIAILVTSAVVLVGAYFVGYTFSAATNVRALFLHPLNALGFLAAYLGVPFSAVRHNWFAVAISFGSLAVVTRIFVFAVKNNRLTSPSVIVFLGSYCFALFSAVITAAGRMDLADPHYGAAKTSRYFSLPLMNWAVFILLCFWMCTRYRKLSVISVTTFFFPAAFVIVAILITFPKFGRWFQGDSNNFAEQQLTTLSIEDGLIDPSLITTNVFPSVDFLLALFPEAKKNQLSIFYKPRSGWLGKTIGTFAPMERQLVPGAITHVTGMRSGVEVVGWADEIRYDWVVLANEGGEIIGFGRHIPAGFPESARARDTPPSLGWVGFISSSQKAKTVSAYVLNSPNKHLFPIAGSASFPGIFDVDAGESGAPINGLAWTGDPRWQNGKLPAPVNFGTVPNGAIYASWLQSDQNTGMIMSSTFSANGCLIQPVLHGPSGNNLSVEIVNADNGQMIGTLPIRSGETTWRYWRVPFDSSVKHVRVIATDQGKDWGQWLAVANPTECR